MGGWGEVEVGHPNPQCLRVLHSQTRPIGEVLRDEKRMIRTAAAFWTAATIRTAAVTVHQSGHPDAPRGGDGLEAERLALGTLCEPTCPRLHSIRHATPLCAVLRIRAVLVADDRPLSQGAEGVLEPLVSGDAAQR